MKILFVICAIALVAAGCQKGGSNQVKTNKTATEFRKTDLATTSLPNINKEVFVFKTFPPKGSTTNLFVHSASGDKPFLPKDYYYVPAANRNDAKPALLPNQLLVQKGSTLAIFNTDEQKLTLLKDISIPAYATIIALNSMTSNSTLIAIIDRDQLSSTAHSSVAYVVNKDTTEVKKINNTLPDNLTAASNRFPIASTLYDGMNNRILQLVLEENTEYTSIQGTNLDTGIKTKLMFPESSNINVTSYITVYPQDNNKNTVSIIDIAAEKLALIPLAVPEYKKNSNSSFMTYSYLGKGFLTGLEYMQDNSMQFTMFQEQPDEMFKPVHTAILPYTFVKAGTDSNLYMVLSSPELTQTRIVQYDILSNTFTGIMTVPGVSSGEVEFLR